MAIGKVVIDGAIGGECAPYYHPFTRLRIAEGQGNWSAMTGSGGPQRQLPSCPPIALLDNEQ
jgi:hypothetical protein